jgi:hypothetical protein
VAQSEQVIIFVDDYKALENILLWIVYVFLRQNENQGSQENPMHQTTQERKILEAQILSELDCSIRRG